jgi:hypothetical protein
MADATEKIINSFFNQEDSIKPKSTDQINRIKNKMILLYDLKFHQNSEIKSDNKINAVFMNKNIPQSFKKKKIKEEIKKTLFISTSAILSYIYFTKVSNMFIRVESLVIFRPIFIFTFCCCPVLISIYFSNLNYKYELENYKAQF